MTSLIKYHCILKDTKVSAYYYEDRYRYTVSTKLGIEYREVVSTLLSSEYALQKLLLQDINNTPYNSYQYSARCIRCSKHHGSPRKQFNLAPICPRCFSAMTDTNNMGNTEYEITPEGSKGNVVK